MTKPGSSSPPARLAGHAGPEPSVLLPYALDYLAALHIHAGDLAMASSLVAESASLHLARTRRDPALHAAPARRLARPGAGGRRAVQRDDPRRPGSRRGLRHHRRALRDGDTPQRAGPVRRGAGRGAKAADGRGDRHLVLGAVRAGGGGVAQRPHGHRPRGRRPAVGAHRAPAARTGRSGPARATGRSSSTATPARACTRRRWHDSARRAWLRPWRARGSPMGNGCAARAAGWTRANSCAPRTTAFVAMGAAGFADRSRRELQATGEKVRGAATTPAMSSRPRRSRSPAWPARAGPTRRSAPSSTSVPARWSGTCARSSPSSASPHARACSTPSPRRARRHHCRRRARVSPHSTR